MTSYNDQSQVRPDSYSQPQHAAPPPAAPPAAQPSQNPPSPRSAPTVTAPRSLVEHLAALPPQQAAALRGIMAGQSYGDIENVIGLKPRTIGYWRTNDPQFIAAANAWRVEVIENSRHSLREAALKFAAAHPEQVRRLTRDTSESQPKKPRRARRRTDLGAK